MNLQPAQQRLLIIIGVALVVLLAGIAVFSGVHSKNMGTVTVDSIPEDLTLTIDGSKRVAAVGSFQVSPGHHTLKALRSGFTDMSQSFDIKKGDKQSYQFYMTPNSPEGYQWQNDHPEQLYKAEGAAGRRFDQNVQAAQQQYPIISKLPVIENTFRIDYGSSQKNPNKTGAIALYIQTDSEQGKADALDWMRTFGYNPDDYEIIYRQPPQ